MGFKETAQDMMCGEGCRAGAEETVSSWSKEEEEEPRIF